MHDNFKTARRDCTLEVNIICVTLSDTHAMMIDYSPRHISPLLSFLLFFSLFILLHTQPNP